VVMIWKWGDDVIVEGVSVRGGIGVLWLGEGRGWARRVGISEVKERERESE